MAEWQVAGKSGKASRRKGPPAADVAVPPDARSRTASEAQVRRCTQAIADARSDVAASQFYAGLKRQLGAATLPHPTSDDDTAAPPLLLGSVRLLVTYGLGSLEQPGAMQIRYQLALSLLLMDLCPGLASLPESYDPVFAALDAAVLPQLGFHVLQHNEQGRRVARQPTLFFMPHCEADLLDNLLTANIEAGTLGNVAILGNSMQQYWDRWSIAVGSGRRRPQALLRLCSCGAVGEVAVQESAFPVTSAFNDMSLHTFAADWQQRLQAAGDT